MDFRDAVIGFSAILKWLLVEETVSDAKVSLVWQLGAGEFLDSSEQLVPGAQ